jgi:hypothetical protein
LICCVGLAWVSGAKFAESEFEEAARIHHIRQASEASFLRNLHDNETLPLVFFDIVIKAIPVGRIEMTLFSDVSPRAAENFR